jgi:two-component system CheB/CheR fusion protein
MTPVTPSSPEDPQFEVLLEFMKGNRGFDFTGYKRASLARRVRRRMSAIGVESYEEYLDRLLVEPDEFTRLFDTILINVTSFFRDSDAWDHLRDELLPELLARREGEPLRFWSAGCASGQEAYSLAMLLAEALGVDRYRERVKIYATDVDEDALAYARQAAYTSQEMEGVPEELRATYFEAVDDKFVFRPEFRRSVIFGRNDLVQDAPISHVDILLCRNTLMYFNADTQAQILSRMHFALRPDSLLFLGKAEMLLSHSAYFLPVDLKRRFFRKVAGERHQRRSLAHLAAEEEANASEEQAVQRLRQAALASSAAAQVVLDADGHLAFCNHRANQLFGLSARDIGRPIQDLELSYRPIELRTHLDEVLNERRQVWLRDVTWSRGSSGADMSLDIQVLPLLETSGEVIGSTVIFNDVTQYRRLQRELEYTNRQLETAYEELQSTNEELETTNEELQSTVEELETTNEELQSTNEELETMNEELQSMNDELQMTNETLRDRQDEVERLNRFMGAVLGGMSAGITVIDQDMKVLAWNSRSEDLWGLRADEVLGEHLFNLDVGLPVEHLRQPLLRQFNDSPEAPQTLELDAVDRRGRSLRARVTINLIQEDGSEPPAAMLVVDVLSAQRAT